MVRGVGRGSELEALTVVIQELDLDISHLREKIEIRI